MNYVQKLMEGSLPLWVIKASVHVTTPEEYDRMSGLSGIYEKSMMSEYLKLVSDKECSLFIWKKYRVSVKSFDWFDCKQIIFDKKIPDRLVDERTWSLNLVSKIWRMWGKNRAAWMGNLQCESKDFQRQFVQYCPFVDWSILSDIIENDRDIKNGLLIVDRIRDMDLAIMQAHSTVTVPNDYISPILQKEITDSSFVLVGKDDYGYHYLHDDGSKEIMDKTQDARRQEMPSLCSFSNEGIFGRRGLHPRVLTKEISFPKIRREIEVWNRYLPGFWLSTNDELYFRKFLIAVDTCYSKWALQRTRILTVAKSLACVHPQLFVFDETGWPIGENWFDPLICCSLQKYLPVDVCLIIELIYRTKKIQYSSYIASSSGPFTHSDYLSEERDRVLMQQLVGGPNLPVHGFTIFSGGVTPIHFLEMRFGGYVFTAGMFENCSVIFILPAGCHTLYLTKWVPSSLFGSVLTMHEVLIVKLFENGKHIFQLPGFVAYHVHIPKNILLWLNYRNHFNEFSCAPLFSGLPVVTAAMSDLMSTNGEIVRSKMRCCGRKINDWNNDGFACIDKELSEFLPIKQMVTVPESIYNLIDSDNGPRSWLELFYGHHDVNKLCLWSTAECGYMIGGGPGPRGKFPRTDNSLMDGKVLNNPHDFHYFMAVLRNDISPEGFYHFLTIEGEKLIFSPITYSKNFIFRDNVPGECLFDTNAFDVSI